MAEISKAPTGRTIASGASSAELTKKMAHVESTKNEWRADYKVAK